MSEKGDTELPPVFYVGVAVAVLLLVVGIGFPLCFPSRALEMTRQYYAFWLSDPRAPNAAMNANFVNHQSVPDVNPRATVVDPAYVVPGSKR